MFHQLKKLTGLALVTVPLILIAISGCADRKSPVEIEAHVTEWNQVTSGDFHGIQVKSRGPGTCQSCHGSDLLGEGDVPSCTDCHAGAGGHPFDFEEPWADPFHGDTIASKGNRSCVTCHGADFRGGWSGVSCYTCHAGGPSGHPDGWLNSRAPTFHGTPVYLEGVADCERCHGPNLLGGTSGVACSDCHN